MLTSSCWPRGSLNVRVTTGARNEDVVATQPAKSRAVKATTAVDLNLFTRGLPQSLRCAFKRLSDPSDLWEYLGLED